MPLKNIVNLKKHYVKREVTLYEEWQRLINITKMGRQTRKTQHTRTPYQDPDQPQDQDQNQAHQIAKRHLKILEK